MSTVNAEDADDMLSLQDVVNVMVGSWIQETGKDWVFETATTEGTSTIKLRDGHKFRELVNEIRNLLQVKAENVSLKLAYQYPRWMSIDHGNGTTPQYISNDAELEEFIEMRRHIEEVNLCVTITAHIGGVPTIANITRDILNPPQKSASNHFCGTLEEDKESDEEWQQFAFSETPMTFPAFGPSQTPEHNPRRNTSIRSRGLGITINEATSRSRPPTQSISTRDKGKGVAVDNNKGKGIVSETDSDDDAVVPTHHPPGFNITQNNTNEGVRRRLFEEGENTSHTESNEDHYEADAESSDEEGSEDLRFSRWGRFEEALHQILTDFSADPALFGRDAPPVFHTNEENEIETAMADVPYEGDKLFVGRIFKSKNDCKIKIAIHAINRRFHFKTTRSSPEYMVMKCISSTCQWRVYSVLLDNTGNFQIRQATLKHTCTVDARRNYHRLATTQVIGELMQAKFVGIKRGPSPAGIRKILLDDYHVNVSYWKAWRAREVAMENAHGSMSGSYALIPAYLALLQNANPGTICFLEHVTDPTGGTRFKYCFIAYGASVTGYQYMRKVIVIDGTSLKGRYGGCLLSACAQDANFQIFPLAFAIVDGENNDSWQWFFEKLSTFVEDSSDLVFVSDRHSSIYNGLEKVFPSSHHAACSVHLWRNVRAEYNPKRVANIVSAAARAFTMAEFNRLFLQIQQLNPGCAAYLLDIGFEHWSRVHFKGRRYNIMDSNIAESWNAVLKEAREYPLICMLEYIRTAVMTWIAMRRAKAMSNEGFFTPTVTKIIDKNFKDSTCLAVRPIANFELQVQTQNGECFTVKLVEGTCSCMEYQQLGIPCAHALAAATSVKLPTESLVSFAYCASTWKNGFEGKIYPVPSVGSGELGGAFEGELLPPIARRPPGRPKKLRIQSRGEFKRSGKKKGRRCSRCRRQGHNKASCRYAA